MQLDQQMIMLLFYKKSIIMDKCKDWWHRSVILVVEHKDEVIQTSELEDPEATLVSTIY